eukprot:TRINITY_DN13516_c0_g1_i1.p2 TRINITY_DN13516_c0_g1~~TRINITY_DN13516_c0_g1_i1.p2  ORF type:complete len:111 (-),score=21.01 TRINITY_DN13516_c0_g1_i1:5-337(-)
MAKKGPMPDFDTIDDYIVSQTEEAQKVLQELRCIIKEAAPDAIEVLNYKVPSFTLVPGGKRGSDGSQKGEKTKHEKSVFFFSKQKTAYEREARDGRSDVCSSDLFFFFFF